MQLVRIRVLRSFSVGWLLIQAYSGVARVIKRSGKSSRVKFRYACNKEYRNTLTYFAFCSLSWSPWARGYYDKARQKGKRHYESLRLLAYKWTRIIFKLWQTGELYSEEYHMKNLERFSKIILKIAWHSMSSATSGTFCTNPLHLCDIPPISY